MSKKFIHTDRSDKRRVFFVHAHNSVMFVKILNFTAIYYFLYNFEKVNRTKKKMLDPLYNYNFMNKILTIVKLTQN